MKVHLFMPQELACLLSGSQSYSTLRCMDILHVSQLL